MGAQVLELDTSIRWPFQVEEAFGRLVRYENQRMLDWINWLRTRNRRERVADVHEAVGRLNSKQLASLTDIPIKVIRQRFTKYVRSGGPVKQSERLLEIASD